MHEMESEGKTVSEAVETALKALGLHREQVEVKIVQESKSGFMGIGSKLAKVKISEKKWVGESSPDVHENTAMDHRPNAQSKNGIRHQNRRAEARKTTRPAPLKDRSEISGRALEVIAETMRLMGLEDAHVQISWDEKQARLKGDISCANEYALLEENGKVLDALQTVVNLIIGRCQQDDARIPVHLDAAGVRANKEAEIFERIMLAVEQVRQTGKPQRLDPMDAAARRAVHKQLADHPDVITASEGESSWRKIVIRPRKK
ncbi:MAG: Jag N-terminal domain-containing protein [Elusimicrobiota bacterium]